MTKKNNNQKLSIYKQFRYLLSATLGSWSSPGGWRIEFIEKFSFFYHLFLGQKCLKHGKNCFQPQFFLSIQISITKAGAKGHIEHAGVTAKGAPDVVLTIHFCRNFLFRALQINTRKTPLWGCRFTNLLLSPSLSQSS